MSAVSFKDHFSGHAADYSRYRPGAYPTALYQALAALAPDTARAWDCATGNGQAALGLAAHFEWVDATDASSKQIEVAQPHPRVRYATAPAEASGLVDASISLVTVAQALHWFDLPKFYTEVRRVAKPEAVIACWCYMHCAVTPAVDKATGRLYEDILGDSYWPPERKHVENAYRDLDFPFTRIELPVSAWKCAGIWKPTPATSRAGPPPRTTSGRTAGTHWNGWGTNCWRPGAIRPKCMPCAGPSPRSRVGSAKQRPLRQPL